MLEIVGHILWMRSEMDVALQGDTPDIPRLDRATRQGLFSAPKDLGGDPGIGGFPMPTGRLVQAGKQIFGDHFHDDYTLLSALVHPVGLAIWSGDMINLPTPSVTEEQAEVFVKVIADGLHSTGHHALALLDVANQSSVVLPRPKPVSG
ncbi:MAG: hypothetical protein ACRDRL_06805 [Sciscionella sp.]